VIGALNPAPPHFSAFREKLHSEKSGSLHYLEPSRRKSDSVRPATRYHNLLLHKV